jgi:glycosyltransferase involved in cell wall biosynthesis
MPMRIGIIYETTFPEFKGGVERWFLQLAEQLARHSMDVQYFNTSGKNELLRGVQYVALKSNSSSFHRTGIRSTNNSLAYARSVFAGLKNSEVDIVYLSGFPFLHIWACKMARKFYRKKYRIYVEWFELPNAKFWVQEFGLLLGIIGFSIQQMSVRLSDVNVAYLKSTEDELCRLQARRQVVLKLPGICLSDNHSHYSPINAVKNDICQIGRLTLDKQPILSLKAVKILRNNGWTGHFHMIGSGPLEKDVTHFVIQHQMTSYVTLHVDGSDTLREKILSSSGVLLHPSKREGFGLVIVEAAALGVPAILIKSKNNKSTELEINPSLFSESDNPKELATLLQKALSKSKEYGEECKQWNVSRRGKMLAEDSIKKLAMHFRSQNEAEEK